MKSYLAYIRVSTVKQGEHGSSLQEQRSAIEAYAVRNDLTITGWYEEMETAAKLGREMFSRLLKELKRGTAAGVIIHKIDRSARNLKDWAHLGELIDMGIDVRFAHESLDMASRGGRLAADIQAVVAADFIRNLRQEVRKGMYGRLKQGFYPLKAPRGYTDPGKAKAKTIDPVVGPLVCQAFELYATGRFSFATLAVEMHRRGLRRKSGKPLSLNGISKMLHNPFYIGLMRIGEAGEIFPGLHEPLISVRTFEHVQALISGKVFSKPQTHDPLFRRMIRCGTCGYGVAGEVKKGHTYYRCHRPTCHGTSIEERFLFEDVEAVLQRLRLSDEELGDIRDFAETTGEAERLALAAQIAVKQKLLALCDGRISRLTDAYVDGTVEKELFLDRKSKLLIEQRALREDLQSGQDTRPSSGLFEKFELGNMAQNMLLLKNAPEFREKLNLIVANLVLRGKELEFTLRFPFADLYKWKSLPSGELYGGTCRTGDTKWKLRTSTDRVVTIDLSTSAVPNPPANLNELAAKLMEKST